MNALEKALKLASEQKKKEAIARKEIEENHARDKKLMLSWINKHVDPILKHSREFAWQRNELSYRGSVIAKINVKWTAHDIGLGEREVIMWCYRIWINNDHFGQEIHFVEELAKIVSEYLL